MNTKRALGSLVAIGVAASLCACGDDEGSSGSKGTTVKSGVAEDRMINSLSAAEAEQVSAAFGKAVQDSGLIDSLCTFSGIFGEQVAAALGQSGQTCEDLSAQCKSAPEQATESTLSVNDDPAQLQSCSITVGELEKCLTAMLGAFKSSLGGITCDSDVQMVTQAFAAGSEVTECQSVQSACPQVVPGAMSEP